MSSCYDGFVYTSAACGGTAAGYSTGQMTGVGNSVARTAYAHDDEGRVQSSTQTVDVARTVSYQYYADQSLSMMQLESTKNHVNCYDVYGRPTWVSASLTPSDCVAGTAPSKSNVYGWVDSYAPHGAIESLNYATSFSGSNYRERWCFNSRLQVTGLRVGASRMSDCTYASGDLLGLKLQYTSTTQTQNNGNVMQQFIQMRKSASDASEIRFRQDYGYDGVNRINYAEEFIEAGTTGGGWSRDWMYDSRGNLVVTGTGTVAGTPTAMTQYDQTVNRLKYYSAALGTAKLMNYDATGNLTDQPADIGTARVTFDYDAENRLRKVDGGATAENFYDGLGRRVKRVVGSTTTTYLYDASGELVREYASAVTGTSGLQFLSVDHLGSTRMITNAATGAVVMRADYEPFGVEIGSSSRVAGGNPGVRQKFTGKERDAETGLDYFGARYFSSAQGRWTSPDWSANPEPVPYADLSDPQTLNLYGYVRNNPLGRSDPDGHVGCGFLWLGNCPDPAPPPPPTPPSPPTPAQVPGAVPTGTVPGPHYPTVEKAAVTQINAINPTSIREDREYGGRVVRDATGQYAATSHPGRKAGVDPGEVPEGTASSAIWHTHGAPDPAYDNEHFSDVGIRSDIPTADWERKPSYLGTPSGRILVYDPATGKVKTIQEPKKKP